MRVRVLLTVWYGRYVVSSEPHQVLKRVQKAEEIAKKERQMKEKLRLLEEAKVM